MKRRFTLVSTLLLLSFIVFKCKKSTDDSLHVVCPEPAKPCFQAKIIRINCATTVFQFLNNSNFGEDKWANTLDNGKVYDDVFSVANKCDIPSEYKEGDVVYVNLASPNAGSCVICAMYDSPPKVSFNVVSIGLLPCNDTGKQN